MSQHDDIERDAAPRESRFLQEIRFFSVSQEYDFESMLPPGLMNADELTDSQFEQAMMEFELPTTCEESEKRATDTDGERDATPTTPVQRGAVIDLTSTPSPTPSERRPALSLVTSPQPSQKCSPPAAPKRVGAKRRVPLTTLSGDNAVGNWPLWQHHTQDGSVLSLSTFDELSRRSPTTWLTARSAGGDYDETDHVSPVSPKEQPFIEDDNSLSSVSNIAASAGITRLRTKQKGSITKASSTTSVTGRDVDTPRRPEQHKSLLREFDKRHLEANEMLLQMEKELKGAPRSFQNQMMNKMRTYRKVLAELQREAKNTNTGFASDDGRKGFYSAENEQRATLNPQRSLLLQGHQSLSRTTDSIARSHCIAAETDAIGQNIVEELGGQREQLERTKDRLINTGENLSKSRKILRSMSRKIVTNKLFLSIIIILEVAILGGVVYFKFFRRT